MKVRVYEMCVYKLIQIFVGSHRSSSHYAVMQVHNKKSNSQGRSPNVVVAIFHTIVSLIKKGFRSHREQILSFKRSSHFEKGHN